MRQERDIWNTLIEAVHARFDALIEEMNHMIAQVGTSAYATWSAEHRHQIFSEGLRAIVADIQEDTPHHFGDMLARTADERVQQGMSIQDILGMLRLGEKLFCDFCHACYPDLEERLLMIERCHGIFAAARLKAFHAFFRSMQDVLHAQIEIVKQLSTPILPIYEGVLVLPLIGPIDAPRADRIMEGLLSAIARDRAFVVILDVTGVPAIDESAAGFLAQAARAAGLLGSRVILVGIGPAIAQTIASGAFDLGGAVTLANLQAGLEFALAERGLFIQRRDEPRRDEPRQDEPRQGERRRGAA